MTTTGVGQRVASIGESRLGRGALAWVLAAVGVVAALAFWLLHDGLVDDAYITLSYASNVAFHLHWGMIPHYTANTATSPLNVLLLAALTAVLRHTMWALGVLFVATYVVLGYSLLQVVRVRRLPAWGAVLATVLVLASPLLLSTVGLETTLAAAMLGLMLMAAVRARPVRFGVYAGLATLTRMDLVIFAVVLLLGTRKLWRGWWKSVLAALAITVPWFAFSWVVLGSAVPDTLFYKTLHHSWGSRTFANGLWTMYLPTSPAAVVLAVLPALLGLVALVIWLGARVLTRSATARRLTPIGVLGAGGVLHFLAYCWIGVPPYHWYYGPALITLSIVFAVCAAAVTGIVRYLCVGLVALVALSQAAFDGHHGLPWRAAPINGNWALPSQYAAIGRGLPARVGGHAVQSPGEVGTIAYFCHCDLVDYLSDRAAILPVIHDFRQRSGGVERWLIDLNFHFLDRDITPIQTDYALKFVTQRPQGGSYWRATADSSAPKGYFVLLTTPH
ncbi:MAG: hypothetical protein ACRDRL_27825 [Sciscionella sp.]